LLAAVDERGIVARDPALEESNRRFRELPLHGWLGFEILQLGSTTVISVDVTDHLQGPFPGTIHGGILATLADVTCALTLGGTFDYAIERPVTTDMHIRYYRQPKSGPVTAEARLVHKGRRLLSTDCSIVDGEDRVLARATATYMIVTVSGAPAAEADA
jgi:uncharacterized protein (TIGR00369 family)